MNFNIIKQLPYIAIVCILNWLYLWMCPTAYSKAGMILSGPIIVAGFWLYKMVATPDSEFTILSVFKKHAMIIVLGIGYYCYDYYMKHHTISVTYVALVCFIVILVLTLLERSIYE